jgi:hypothetical protein
MWGKNVSHTNLSGNFHGNRPFGKLRRRWNNNIEMDLWTKVVKSSSRAFLEAVDNYQVLKWQLQSTVQV